MKNNVYHINSDIKTKGIQTFSFDNKLDQEDLYIINETFLSCQKIDQIYFKDNIDLDSIEKIKYILETSGHLDDSSIEKYILIDYSSDMLDSILAMNYLNPNLWKITYKRTDGIKEIVSITEYRKINKYFDLLIDNQKINKYSMLEKICIIYDQVKLLDFEKSNKNLLTIIETKCANSYGYNLLYQEILNKFGIKSYIEKVKSEEPNRFITAIKVDDNKYKIKGIYLFDPYSDSLPIYKYKSLIRRINYSYFGLTLEQLNNTIYQEKISGILNYFISPNKKLFIEKIEELKLMDKHIINKFNSCFSCDYDQLYDDISNTQIIDNYTLFQIIDEIVDNNQSINIDNIDYLELIKNNYIEKKGEMFN